MAKSFFSLDLGEYYIKVSDLQINNGILEPTAIGIMESEKIFATVYPDKIVEQQAGRISQFLSKLQINKSVINCIIPDTLSFNQIVEMPQLNEKELLSAIKYQADQFIPLPIEDVSLDVEILHEFVKEKKVIAFLSAAPKKFIERVQKLIEYAGLTIDSIETETSATSRLISEIHKKKIVQQDPGANIFIYIGYNSTTLYFFDNALNLVTQNRNFNIGLSLFIKEVQVNLNLQEMQSIEVLKGFTEKNEKNNSIESVLSPVTNDFIFQIDRFIKLTIEKYKLPIKNIYLTGEAIRLPFLQFTVANYFKTPTSGFDMISHIKKTPQVETLKNQLGYFMSSFGGSLR